MTDRQHPRAVETVVVGAGQSGLIVSGLLSRGGREHVVLERRTLRIVVPAAGGLVPDGGAGLDLDGG